MDEEELMLMDQPLGQWPPTETLGKLFPDGSAIEALRGTRLILWRPNSDARVDILVECNGSSYAAARLHPDLEDVLQLPDRTEDFGCIDQLITRISERIAKYAPVNENTMVLLASFVLSSWAVECLPSAPVLNLWGPVGTENPLIDLLSCLCRRSLRLAEPSLPELSKLPRGLCPTVILKRPSVRALSQLLLAATEPEFNVLRSGHLSNLQCAMIVYTEEPLAGAVVSVPLLHAAREYDRIPKSDAQQLADELQPQLLRYRLSQHLQISNSQFDVPTFAPTTRALVRVLGAAAEGAPHIQEHIMNALEHIDEQHKAEQSQGYGAVVMEALLALTHEKKPTAYVFEITKLVNGILLGRHEVGKLSPKAVGAILRRLGLYVQRHGPGYQLVLNNGASTRIHRLAAAHNVLTLQIPVPGCACCNEIFASSGS